MKSLDPLSLSTTTTLKETKFFFLQYEHTKANRLRIIDTKIVFFSDLRYNEEGKISSDSLRSTPVIDWEATLDRLERHSISSEDQLEQVRETSLDLWQVHSVLELSNVNFDHQWLEQLHDVIE